MTHQNHQTNGASLEDCHTNFFALTELYGIKWRKLVWGETNGGDDGDEGAAPLGDPVISSYARCLAGDILCVWRRVPAAQPTDLLNDIPVHIPPPLSLRASKELWIFWYGEEPDLNGLVAPELIASQGVQGSWESGLSYECRSLLFKALHNLIERCLLSRDFVRLGKWFVQPYDGDEEDVGKSPWHLSFSFAFFLHGESTVCASVDVRQHPPVRTLTAKRLAKLNSPDHNADAKVILAPFGLEGTVTGREWNDADAATARLLDAWRQLYPLEQGCGAVEVVCGGARMRYPLPYVLVTDMEAAGAGAGAGAGHSQPHHPQQYTHGPHIARRALRALTTPHPTQTAEVCYNDTSVDKCDDFVDPTRKTPCSCAKWRRRRGPRPPPFHRRRHAPALAPGRRPAHDPALKTPSHLGQCGGAVGGGCGGGLSPGSCGGGSPAGGVSAPSSAGAPPPPPSPHHAHAHAVNNNNNNTAQQTHQCGGGGVLTTLHTPAPTPDPLAPPTPAPPAQPPHKTYEHAQGESPRGGGGGGVGGWSVCMGARPVLPPAERRLDPTEDEHELHMLYDYTTIHAWLEHPVKRFKAEENSFSSELALGGGGAGIADGGGAAGAGDLYAGHDHTRMPDMHSFDIDIKQEKPDHNDDTKEYKNLFTSDGLCPTIKDLDQIFENSDDAASGDETVRLLAVQTPPDSNKSSDESRCTSRYVRPEELSKMFPTPPSMEAHAQPSPGFSLPDDATTTTLRHHHIAAGSPLPDTTIEDWSYVFKPPTVCKYVGSSKYAPLATLPSQLLPAVTLPPHAVYRPRCLPRDHEERERDTEPDADTSAASAGANGGSGGSGGPATGSSSAGTTRTSIKRSLSPTPEPRSRRTCSPRANINTNANTNTNPTNTVAARAHHAACPLLLNVLLADTVLNVFRDHNFDSCTLCVCNAEAEVKVVGNIRGADAATYLNGTALDRSGGGGGGGGGGAGLDSLLEDEPSSCTCGFSAIVNRRLAHRAGLFYEDELEITGVAEEPGGRGGAGGSGGGGGGGGLVDVAGVVVAQCAALAGGNASALTRAANRAAAPQHNEQLTLNLLEYTDGSTAAARALRAASGTSGSGASAGPGAAASGTGTVHRWPFIGARAPRSSRDIVRLMRRLRPLLQDAIQKRCCGARMWDGVTGPLTWRQFHRLAGRGNEDLCEPQPVPPLLVGHDADWVSVSPYALRHWERLALEPYSYARDVAYVVVAADLEALDRPLRSFFRELSAAYEACRLGRHRPVTRLAPDGILRAPSAARTHADDEWAGALPPGRLGDYIRAYSDALRSTLVPTLASLTLDRSLLEGEKEPMRPPATPDRTGSPGPNSEAESPGGGGGGGGGASMGGGGAWEEEEGGAPALVVYVVEPPAALAHRPAALHALLRLAARTHHHLHHHNPLVKIISVESVCSLWGAGAGGGASASESAGSNAGAGAGEARALAFSVFSGARRLLAHKPDGKSLTGFGTAAQANLFLQAKDEKNLAPYKLFSPAWVLAAPRALKEVAETWGQGAGEPGGGGVLFLAYCLSHDQRWLLAAATDARGELLDTVAINIHVPHRCRRRRGGPARRLGLTKLMDFTLGVMSQAAQPWRLVVGRVGRIGHGELKGWSWLLSSKHLKRASNMLREICGSCSILYPSGMPCIQSACLVSTEPDSCLRLMADRFTPDERFSQASIQSHLHTPRDVTATHILVFPTSATTQSNQIPFEPPMANGEDGDMLFPNMDEDMGEDNMAELFIGDVFNMWAPASPRGSPPRAGDGDDPVGSPHPGVAHQLPNYHHQDEHNQEQVGTVLQQPLALGYMVSTAPLGAMPAWWWAGCWHLRDACPAFLKNALHLHAGSLQAADDFTSLTQRRDHNAHPLDSQTTTDVLRYVLEGYNALSWLALDVNTHDRLSCLPLHVQVLMQLYHTAAALG